jgi:hypothetical protein
MYHTIIVARTPYKRNEKSTRYVDRWGKWDVMGYRVLLPRCPSHLAV